jgi:hypothetical protein
MAAAGNCSSCKFLKANNNGDYQLWSTIRSSIQFIPGTILKSQSLVEVHYDLN